MPQLRMQTEERQSDILNDWLTKMNCVNREKSVAPTPGRIRPPSKWKNTLKNQNR